MQTPDSFHYLDPQLQREPMEFLRVLREQAPVYREPVTGAYIVSRAADLRAAASKPDVFSNVIDPTVFRSCQGLVLRELDPEVAGILDKEAWLTPNTLLLNDPPVHGRYRRIVSKALSSVEVAGLEPQIAGHVARFIGAFDGNKEVDFVEEFAHKLPLSIILRFVGAPESDMPLINHWSHMFFSTLMGQSTREQYLQTVHAVAEMYQFVAKRIAAVREKPDDTWLSALVQGHEVGEQPLTHEELLSIFHVVLFAGHDTTRQSLGSSMRALARDPALYARVRADRALIKPLIDEVLRLNSPANITARRTVTDTELGGVTIPANSMVFMAWGSGNRDAAEWEQPDEFQCPRKGGSSHLSFGYGIHTCVGMRLAKAQISASLNAFFDRYRAIELTVPEQSLEYVPSINLRGLARLPIRCTPLDA